MNTQHSNSSPRGGREGASLKEVTAIVLLTFGIILAFVALLMPPPGEMRIPVDTRSPIPVISVQSVGDLQYRWQS